MQAQTTTNKNGEFIRAPSTFRSWVTEDGAAGSSGVGGFAAEPGRYHLYVAYNCPWAHRTIIIRALKQLEEVISLSAVHPQRSSEGWTFLSGDAVSTDDLNRFSYLKEAYHLADSSYAGRFTVPVLWDKKSNTIVNNESADIIRMLNSAFNAITPVQNDYYPLALRSQIDSINDFIYHNVNNGVYRAGFAKSQSAYDQAYDDVFSALDKLEELLSQQHYLVGEHITEADWRLFPTLIRFDVAYYGIFKCNKRRLIDYTKLWDYTRELYQLPGIAETVNFEHIKLGYWRKSERNSTGIIPKGPDLSSLW
ncbi:MAG: glutathione S-transferase family protein [Pseudomonadales bacterium]